ncbi:MAG: methyltransferase [Burkholderiales bacterium]|nr:methyltransferase [Burkholderiales bacterium]
MEPIAAGGEVEPYLVCGLAMKLAQAPGVFRPTLTTRLLLEQVLAGGVAGKTALDLGCGSGPIAIALAMAGAARVVASDVMPHACDLTRRNVLVNGLADRVEVVTGSLFAPFGGRRFDVIVDDVSGVAEVVARKSSWFPDGVPLGGADGADLAVQMLAEAGAHLDPGGALYFPVLSLSNVRRILDAAERHFPQRVEKLASKLVPFSPELNEHLALLSELKDGGVIDFEQVRGRSLWRLDIYKASAAA